MRRAIWTAAATVLLGCGGDATPTAAPTVPSASASAAPVPSTSASATVTSTATEDERPVTVATFGTDIERIDLFRLDGPPANWDASAPADEAHLAGFPIRAGSQRTLDATLAADVGALLRAPKGFDDVIAKRCAMKHLIGLRVTRKNGWRGEIAIDFACNKLFVVAPATATEPKRRVLATHFDPSRPAFLEVMKRAAVGDPEIAALR